MTANFRKGSTVVCRYALARRNIVPLVVSRHVIFPLIELLSLRVRFSSNAAMTLINLPASYVSHRH